MNNDAYGIKEAFVFQNDNVSMKGNVVYYPIYMLMFVENKKFVNELIYTLDIDILK